MNKTKWVIGTGTLLGILCGVWIFRGAFSDKEFKWVAAAAGYLIGVVFSAWGMWRLNRLALWISYLLAAASFGFGVYMTHFRWTFWLWKEPTYADRVAAVTLQNPEGVLLLGFSVFWVLFFTRPKNSALFH